MMIVKYIHFIGIGGAGMCGIAEVLMHAGYYVTGSDIIRNNAINRLRTLGIKIFLGHDYNNVHKESDVVVISSAISSNNPEILAAKSANIPIIQRAEMLFEIMRFKYGIVISGTHGKTTTTAIISDIYIKAGLDPTFINGGIIKSEGVRARLGCSNYFIAEADESDGSFLYLRPMIAVITNIDIDHMIMYRGNFEYLKKIFIKFLHNLPFYGCAVVCIDNSAIREILPNINRKVITYGFSTDADLYITDYYQHLEQCSFLIKCKNKKKLQIILNIPGRHNALNATAAVAVAIERGIDDVNIVQTMRDFKGINRRLENLGYYSLSKINGKKGKILLLDDYGHHPTALQETIITIRTGWPNKRLVMIFQPHRFTRVKELYNNFIKVLSCVDVLFMLEVYSAGESFILGLDSKSLCNAIHEYGKIDPIFIFNINMLFNILAKYLQNNDLLLIQGAGTIGEIVRSLLRIHKI